MHASPRNRFLGSGLVAGALACLPAGEALACPNCLTARVVRASVFDAHFWPNLFLISLPLLIMGIIGALLYQIGIDRSGVNHE